MVLRVATVSALLVGCLALPSAPKAPKVTFSSHNMTATMANTREAVRRHRTGEKVRMLHGSGIIPAVTMEYWKDVQTQGPILLISAAGGAGAPGSAASYINNFLQMGIEMSWLPIYGSNCPLLADGGVLLDVVREAHAIYFSGGMPGMLQGCLYGIDGTLEEGKTVEDGESTEILDLILSKQVVGGDSAGLMAQPAGPYFTGIFPHDGATLIGQGQCPTGNVGLRTYPADYFIAHSHFSERGQHGPQLVAQWQEGVRIGAGFDEALAGYYFEESGDILMVADPDDPTLRGVWIFELLDGSEDGQVGLLAGG